MGQDVENIVQSRTCIPFTSYGVSDWSSWLFDLKRIANVSAGDGHSIRLLVSFLLVVFGPSAHSILETIAFNMSLLDRIKGHGKNPASDKPESKILREDKTLRLKLQGEIILLPTRLAC